jgi:hypothetical protein
MQAGRPKIRNSFDNFSVDFFGINAFDHFGIDFFDHIGIEFIDHFEEPLVAMKRFYLWSLLF